MPSPQIERKLAAIMFTDIAGYTALSAKDSTKSSELLTTQRDTLKPIVEKHGGSWMKEIGDGLLLTFDSATSAVECSIAIQEATKDIENLNLRIGIHEGEVIKQDGDVIGDDVNVASRIEPFSAIGGVAISQKIQQAISSNKEFETKYIGKPKLKGVAQEVEVHCISSNGLPISNSITLKSKKLPLVIISIGLLITFIIGIVSYKKWNYNMYYEHGELSISVMLTENLSDENNVLNRTIAEDMIIDISRLSSGKVFVPSLNETKNIRGNFKIISSSVNTKYILESSILTNKKDYQLRCRLLESNTGKSIYSKKMQGIKDELPIAITAISIGILNNLDVKVQDYFEQPQNMLIEL
jgi:class 3 adenylate cyclase/TolB-like protein